MFLSKYGVARVIEIPIVKRAVVDFAVGADWTPAAGDVKIIKDGGAAANVTNLPTAIASGNGAVWSFSLTATEMQAARVVVTVVDAATKAVEDQSFVIETYGNASAQHEFDLDTPTVTLAATGSAAFTESYAADGAAATLPQLLYMLLALLSEKSISGTTLTAKKLDGVTTAGTFTLNSSTAPTSVTRAT